VDSKPEVKTANAHRRRFVTQGWLFVTPERRLMTFLMAIHPKGRDVGTRGLGRNTSG
jgi:hypothetical protein